jgi:hypothetical protein
VKHHPSATPSLRKKKRVVSLLGGPTRKFDDDDDDEKMCLFAKEKGNEEILRSTVSLVLHNKQQTTI